MQHNLIYIIIVRLFQKMHTSVIYPHKSCYDKCTTSCIKVNQTVSEAVYKKTGTTSSKPESKIGEVHHYYCDSFFTRESVKPTVTSAYYSQSVNQNPLTSRVVGETS